MRAAKTGDHFVLLIPDPLAEPVERRWQSALQRQVGGLCTAPLHVSLQRFQPQDEAQLHTFAQTLQRTTIPLAPLPLTGIALRPLYSKFRERYVLKCQVRLDDPLVHLFQTVKAALAGVGLKGDYRRVMALVTVVEGMMRPLTLTTQPLPNPLPIFSGATLVISRVTGREQYEELFSWSLTGKTPPHSPTPHQEQLTGAKDEPQD